MDDWKYIFPERISDSESLCWFGGWDLLWSMCIFRLTCGRKSSVCGWFPAGQPPFLEGVPLHKSCGFESLSDGVGPIDSQVGWQV